MAILRTITFIFVMWATCSVCQSQVPLQPSVVSIQLGAGIAGGVKYPGNVLLGDTLRGIEANVSRGLVAMVSFDYLLTPRFSIGGLLGFQAIEVATRDSFMNNFETGKVNRYYAGFRGLWHYGKSDKIDLFSGFKVGTVIFEAKSIEVGHDEESEIEADNNRSRMAIGFVPIGARFFVLPNLGLNVETSIGSPAFLSWGINYRF